jgi:hypothetical protein
MYWADLDSDNPATRVRKQHELSRSLWFRSPLFAFFGRQFSIELPSDFFSKSRIWMTLIILYDYLFYEGRFGSLEHSNNVLSCAERYMCSSLLCPPAIPLITSFIGTYSPGYTLMEIQQFRPSHSFAEQLHETLWTEVYAECTCVDGDLLQSGFETSYAQGRPTTPCRAYDMWKYRTTYDA